MISLLRVILPRASLCLFCLVTLGNWVLFEGCNKIEVIILPFIRLDTRQH